MRVREPCYAVGGIQVHRHRAGRPGEVGLDGEEPFVGGIEPVPPFAFRQIQVRKFAEVDRLQRFGDKSRLAGYRNSAVLIADIEQDEITAILDRREPELTEVDA